VPRLLTTHGAVTVLVVDDDWSTADNFARLLRLEGFCVHAAQTPMTGLKLAESFVPHAIILDLLMPVMDGLTWMRQLRANTQLAHTPVAIVTGEYVIDDATMSELLSLGVTMRYKPLWGPEVVDLAVELLNLRVIH
jgi:DNA-binding response OmpR family regulator